MSHRDPDQLQKVPAWETISLREDDPEWVTAVSDSVMDLDYGSVQIVVHDGEVVQPERVERVRFNFRQRQ